MYGEVIEQIKAARAKAVESKLTASRMKEMAQSETAGGGEGRISQSVSPQVNVEARSYCFMRFSVDGEAVGSVLLQLFDDLLPTTAANFLAFCRGEVAINGRSYGYAGCPLHRIVRGFVLQGGDVISGDGGGCVSAVGEGGTFADESFAVPHSRQGLPSPLHCLHRIGFPSHQTPSWFHIPPSILHRLAFLPPCQHLAYHWPSYRKPPPSHSLLAAAGDASA